MEVDYVDVWVTRCNPTICVSCVSIIAWCEPSACHLCRSLCWKQALFKAFKLVSVCSNQTMLQHSSKLLLLCVETRLFFFLSQSTQIKQLMCWKLTFWKHYGKFSCEDFNTLHVCFSFFCICADTSTHPFTFAWIFNKVADVTLGEGMLKLYSGNSRYQFFFTL